VAGLEREGEGVRGVRDGEVLRFSGEEPVSMNCWAFTPAALGPLQAGLARFLAVQGSSTTAECPLPDTVQDLVARGEATVQLLAGGREWFGVTYPADRPGVEARLRRLAAG
jgi:hypothetical protein